MACTEASGSQLEIAVASSLTRTETARLLSQGLVLGRFRTVARFPLVWNSSAAYEILFWALGHTQLSGVIRYQ